MLVGFSGRMHSGKDTAFDALKPHFIARRFAGPLKTMLRAMLEGAGVDKATSFAMIEGNLKETALPVLGGHTPRHAMQTLGTEWGRKQMGADFWVGLARANVERALAAGWNVAMLDVRFQNEVQMIHDLGGKVYRITRPSASDQPVLHSSECLPHYDLEIVNDGTVEELQAKVRYIILGALKAQLDDDGNDLLRDWRAAE